MGYTTEFYGQVDVVPVLSTEEYEFLEKFNNTRRMENIIGPYWVDQPGNAGQDDSNGVVIEYNKPPEGQPGLWCGWMPGPDQTCIEWDGTEKFHYATEWMEYLIAHFIGSTPLAKKELPFLQGHVCNGLIEAKGEDVEDIWAIEVKDNVVQYLQGEITYSKPIA